MPIHLSTALLVGVAEIDRQHDELFRRQNDLLRSLTSEEGQFEVARAITLLLSYATHHFEAEEELMRQAGFPALDAHREEHRRFLGAVAGCKAQLIASKQTDGDLLQMETQLAGWLVSHITTADLPIGVFMRRANAAGRSPTRGSVHH